MLSILGAQRYKAQMGWSGTGVYMRTHRDRGPKGWGTRGIDVGTVQDAGLNDLI